MDERQPDVRIDTLRGGPKARCERIVVRCLRHHPTERPEPFMGVNLGRIVSVTFTHPSKKHPADRYDAPMGDQRLQFVQFECNASDRLAYARPLLSAVVAVR